MLSGELYSPFSSDLVEERRKAKDLQRQFNFGEKSGDRELLLQLLPNAGSDIHIEAPFYCDYGYNIHCGKRVFFNVNCVVLDAAKITIGSRVLIGPAVQIYATTHPTNANDRKSKGLAKEIQIGDDCWIGGGAVICPGVTIGNGSIIGAGAVVTKNIPANSLAVGNPARVVKKLT